MAFPALDVVFGLTVNLLSKMNPFLPPNNGPPCETEGQLERSRSRTSPQDEPAHSFLYRYHPWLPFHRCPMRRSFYNQRGGKFRRNFPS